MEKHISKLSLYAISPLEIIYSQCTYTQMPVAKKNVSPERKSKVNREPDYEIFLSITPTGEIYTIIGNVFREDRFHSKLFSAPSRHG